jgi:hypothetical protein
MRNLWLVPMFGFGLLLGGVSSCERSVEAAGDSEIDFDEVGFLMAPLEFDDSSVSTSVEYWNAAYDYPIAIEWQIYRLQIPDPAIELRSERTEFEWIDGPTVEAQAMPLPDEDGDYVMTAVLWWKNSEGVEFTGSRAGLGFAVADGAAFAIVLPDAEEFESESGGGEWDGATKSDNRLSVARRQLW